MKQYKVIECKKKEVENIMNQMAKEGWEVVSVNYWTYWKVSLMITFVKNI